MGRDWDERKHPRDRKGRFGHGHGGTPEPQISVTTRSGSGALVRESAPSEIDTHGKMTEGQFERRAAKVEKVIGDVWDTHATDKTHKIDGRWTPERRAAHRQIVNDLYGEASGVPNEGKAIIAGGLGGAGKTTVLTKHAGVDTSQYLTINPDDIKEELARRNMIPDVPGGEDLSPMERAALVHEESSDIAQQLARRAYADRKNVMWDITMSSESSVTARVDALNGAGYTQVDGVFVDIPVEVSVERAMARYRRGVEKFQAGEGLGGRYVPPRIIRAQRTSTGQTVNREVFGRLKQGFTGWSMYDNSVTGRPPVLVGQRGT